MEVKTNPGRGKIQAKRGVQTLFRVTARTQLNLIRIADNKANMIMGINALIITVLIGIISRDLLFLGEDFSPDWALLTPMISIILTALLTTVFAVRAVKPRLLSLKKSKSNPAKKSGLLFFEDIWDVPLDQYIQKMEDLISSPSGIYQNLILDIHSQAKVLHKKYELLRWAYTIFMAGLVISILIFLFMVAFIY